MMEMHSKTENAEKRHEIRDVHIRGVIIFGVGLFASLAITLFLMSKIFHYFEATQSLGPPASPFAETRTLPAHPQLQTEPRQDLKGLRSEQEKLLNSYGWVDRNLGIVRIPIDRAMDLLAQRGLPVRSGPSAGRPEKK